MPLWLVEWLKSHSIKTNMSQSKIIEHAIKTTFSTCDGICQFTLYKKNGHRKVIEGINIKNALLRSNIHMNDFHFYHLGDNADYTWDEDVKVWFHNDMAS